MTDIGEIAHPNVTRSIMKKSHQCWLHEQLLPWESEGFVTNETVQKLRERYALNDSQPALGQIVMGSLGALFIGAELVRNRITKEPAVPEIDLIVEQMKERGFLLSTDGPLYNVLKIKPPIVFSKKNADNMVRNLDEVLNGFIK